MCLQLIRLQDAMVNWVSGHKFMHPYNKNTPKWVRYSFSIKFELVTFLQTKQFGSKVIEVCHPHNFQKKCCSSSHTWFNYMNLLQLTKCLSHNSFFLPFFPCYCDISIYNGSFKECVMARKDIRHRGRYNLKKLSKKERNTIRNIMNNYYRRAIM
jgi:hypothetical protein